MFLNSVSCSFLTFFDYSRITLQTNTACQCYSLSVLHLPVCHAFFLLFLTSSSSSSFFFPSLPSYILCCDSQKVILFINSVQHGIDQKSGNTLLLSSPHLDMCSDTTYWPVADIQCRPCLGKDLGGSGTHIYGGNNGFDFHTGLCFLAYCWLAFLGLSKAWIQLATSEPRNSILIWLC